MTLTAELSQTLTMILAGGQGERLIPLTRERAKPAVPFGGLYRIIDFTLSNCIHSGLRRIYCLTQYKAHSLEEHLRFGWSFLPRRLGQFLSARPPHLGSSANWYGGTADAIYQNLDAVEQVRPDRVLILSGDQIYKMDYGQMLAEHLEHDAALTIGAVAVPVNEARRFGVFECDESGRVRSFEEKPAHPKEIPDRPGYALASMGIYLFRTEELRVRLLEDAARRDSSHDFGRDVIPGMIHEVNVYTHRYTDIGNPGGEPYWRDIGTLDSFYEANMDLLQARPAFNLYGRDWPTLTLQHAEPPARAMTGTDETGGAVSPQVLDSLFSPGVVVRGGSVRGSILSHLVEIEVGGDVKDSILFAGVKVGRGARIRRAIIDKWTEVPAGASIGFDPARDRERFLVTDSGITVVPRGYRFGAADEARAASGHPKTQAGHPG